MSTHACPHCGGTISVVVRSPVQARTERAQANAALSAEARRAKSGGHDASALADAPQEASALADAKSVANALAGSPPQASAVAKPERAAPPPRQPRARRPAPPEPPEPPEPDEPQAEPEPAIEEIKPSYPPVCARCGKRMVNWSPIAWRCSGCCRNYPKA